MALAAGTRLGNFEITGQIGAGGMGEVYRATDTKLGREVAIKTLPAALASDKDRLARFEREAKLLASMNHAHIAAVHSLDEHEGTLYIAMELVEGETLEEKLKAGPLPVEDALRLALQIAEALEAAHEKGVVHRDLKPANIMVTGDGQVKVLDFGLAKAFSGDPNEASPAHYPLTRIARRGGRRRPSNRCHLGGWRSHSRVISDLEPSNHQKCPGDDTLAAQEALRLSSEKTLHP